MIAIKNTLVSEDLIQKKFVCDLNSCKGACCVEGESGAPLEKEELKELQDAYPHVKPFMTPDGIDAVEKYGVYVVDSDGDDTTTLVEGKQCAFSYFEENIARCAIEKAWQEKKISFQKPVSCHLYPVRVTQENNVTQVNYEKWEVCKPACKCGEKLNVPVYKFTQAALIRKFGKEWFKQLEAATNYLSKR